MKRFSDIIFAIIGLILFAPIFVFMLIFTAIRFKLRIFSKQTRVGKNNKTFKMYEFRARHRRCFMHKIPRLINLLKGNISLVGPRPIAKSEVSRVKQRTASGAFTLTPGVTGFTRIANRKNTISVLEESLLDTKYLQSRSFLTDTGIIFKTVFTFKKRTRKAPILAPLTVHVRPPASQTGVLYIPRNRYANFLGAKA